MAQRAQKESDSLKRNPPAGICNPDLARWIRKLWHTKHCQRIELIHAAQSGRDRVCVWGRDQLSGKEPQQILEEIYTEAQEDVINFAGQQRYAVFFFETDNPNPHRKIFSIRGSTEIFETDDEVQDALSLAQELVRLIEHDEACVQLAIQGFSEAQKVMQRVLTIQKTILSNRRKTLAKVLKAER